MTSHQFQHSAKFSEDLDERTGLWYHESWLSYKGFGSWGRAGSARPHMKQNPCTRFGLDVQTSDSRTREGITSPPAALTVTRPKKGERRCSSRGKRYSADSGIR